MRGFWKLGKVQKLIQGSDGHVRGAVIRLSAKGNQATLLRGPLQCLYPLEVGHVACNNDEAKDVTHDEGVRTSDKESQVDTVRTV